ncbi:MAG: hypothetical protein O3A25_19845 [Acidobacteria bacterium]|nr:hypothetical protein [Acidobacteriota bacterium]
MATPLPAGLRVAVAGVLVFVLAVLATTRASGQGSPYLSLDDPRLPLLEYLITRGDVRDPSPQIRPLLLNDVLAALRAAARDSSSPSTPVVRELLQAWELPAVEAWWRVAPRAGAQAYTQSRRDPLRPGGRGAVRPYADASLTLGLGSLVASARPAMENRLRDDPDYRPDAPVGELKQMYRFIEAYATGQWRWVSLHFGQVERNWGPVGLVGIPTGNYAYPRTDFAFRLGNRTVRFEAVRAPLRDGVSDSGQVVTRWFAAHRLSVRLGRNLDVALWEAGVAQRAGGAMDPAILNPFLLMTFGRQFGLGDRRNVMLGADATWRPSRRLLLQVQGAIDDWTFDETNPYPNRFGFTVLAGGALGRSLSWRASYAMNSSLAYRTANPNENFTDAGVGIGRNFIDNDQVSFGVGLPVLASWLVSPQIQLLRQGEGHLDAPWPGPEVAATLPVLFIGTRQDTWQATVGVSGQQGRVALSGLGGLGYLRNARHIPGATETRFVGRLQVTVEFRAGGSLPE